MKKKTLKTIVILISIVVVILIVTLAVVSIYAKEESIIYYKVSFDEGSKVYDGDTIQDVYVEIYDFGQNKYPEEGLWPGVVIKGDKLYAVTDIRLEGIDTPETRPAKKGRTAESRNKEKAAAKEAKALVIDLLEKHDMQLEICHPQFGKYAGRIVAEVFIGKNRLDVDEWLIDKGYGYYYDGKTKRKFDEWYKQQ